MNGTLPNLNELAVFGAVAGRRSFTGGARQLRLPKATVSRKVRGLEERLGVRLLQRTTRKVTLTEAGEALLARWQLIEEQLEQADAEVGRLRGTPRGLLRVAAPPTLMAEWVAPLAAQFLARHPGVRIELLARSEAVELVGRGADLAVTHGPQRDSTQVTRLLGTLPTGLYAARAYLARQGAPATPEALSEHATLFFASSPITLATWQRISLARSTPCPPTPTISMFVVPSFISFLPCAGRRAGARAAAAPRVDPRLTASYFFSS